MIDIVFLLIIFFITVTQITKVNQEKLPLAQRDPSTRNKQSPKSLSMFAKTATLSLMEKGNRWLKRSITWDNKSN